MLPVDIQVPVPGSYNSALAKPLPELSHLPATKTLPFVSSVAVKLLRPILMLPVAVHVPGVAAVAAVATVPVTDLLNPAKARRRPSEQRTKPITARGSRNGLFFIRTSSCASEPCRFADFP